MVSSLASSSPPVSRSPVDDGGANETDADFPNSRHRPMRRHTAATAAVLAGLFPCSAFADHCQTPRPLEALGIGFRGGVAAELATYDTAHASGDYQGLSLVVSYEMRWLRLRALLPAYRLTR